MWTVKIKILPTKQPTEKWSLIPYECNVMSIVEWNSSIYLKSFHKNSRCIWVGRLNDICRCHSNDGWNGYRIVFAFKNSFSVIFIWNSSFHASAQAHQQALPHKWLESMPCLTSAVASSAPTFPFERQSLVWLSVISLRVKHWQYTRPLRHHIAARRLLRNMHSTMIEHNERRKNEKTKKLVGIYFKMKMIITHMTMVRETILARIYLRAVILSSEWMNLRMNARMRQPIQRGKTQPNETEQNRIITRQIELFECTLALHSMQHECEHALGALFEFCFQTKALYLNFAEQKN